MTKKKIDLLIISPIPTHPPDSGNKIRIKNLLDTFDSLGLEWFLLVLESEADVRREMVSAWGSRVDFIMPAPPKRTLVSKIRSRLRIHTRLKKAFGVNKMPDHYKVDSWISQHVFEEIAFKMNRFEPNGIWVEYVFMSKCFEFISPDIPKFLDTHDVFADRRKIYESVNREPEWFYTTPDEEKKGCLRADYVIAIQDKEKHVFSSYGCNTAVVAHMLDIVPAAPSQTTVPTICFIGSDYVANIDAINHFLSDMLPEIRKSCPGVQVEIYGDVCKKLDACLPDDVIPMGRVKDLTQAYQNAWVVIAPIRMGTGLKIKSIEALSRGRALVGTEEGTKGLGEGVDSGFLTARSNDEFAQQCIRLLTDTDYREELQLQTIKFCLDWNNTQVAELKRIFTESNVLHQTCSPNILR